MDDDGDFLKSFSLPPFAALLAEAKGREVTVREVLTGGCVLHGKAGLIGVNVGIGQRQTRFWLPSDHPDYDRLQAGVTEAVATGRKLPVTFDPVNHIVLDMSAA